MSRSHLVLLLGLIIVFHYRSDRLLGHTPSPHIMLPQARKDFEIQTLNVVDMRWGVRDEATDDHMGTELCLKELRLCQQLSTGPSFVSLLSHKYGYIAFPRVIAADEFEPLMTQVEDPETVRLFHKWYTRDDNAVPPAYILTSISTHIPEYISKDKGMQKGAKEQWTKESEQMQDALESAATRVFDQEKARKYIISVTETEVEEGLLKAEDFIARQAIWLRRNIEDIDRQESSWELSRYTECKFNLGAQKVERAQRMLQELKEHRMERRLNPDHIFHYNVQWVGKHGIEPDTSAEQRKYLTRLCKDFTDIMISLVTQAIQNRKLLHDRLTEECMQHIRLCQAKCAEFHGRTETLERIKSYLLDQSAKAPLVVHGISGTGKTSILAMTAKLCKTWLPKTPKLVLRFLGTTVESSSVLPLLQSLVQQLSILGNQSLRAELTIDLLKVQLNLLLEQGTAECPLVVILDSLDQLDTSHHGHSLMWLPASLPPHCKIVMSSLPEEKYETFPALKKLFPDEDRYIQVPELGQRDALSIVSLWAEKRNRKLTPPQMDILLSTFRKCPTPLFLKMSFDEAMLWRSFDPPSRTVLQTTVRTAVDFLFSRLEKLHSRILVCRALGYLTLANNGITEAELDDVLSCDDDVLNDVYAYWIPPMRRLPPLLLVRIRTDIDQYIVERGADGARVLNWYHRQFTEAAHERYCADDAQNKRLHGNLADFFAGTWANGRKKPYSNAKGDLIEEDRYVTSQPLHFGEDDYNIRALNNLPYHRMHAGNVDLLKKECLANVHFCVAKLHPLPVEALLDDFTAAKAAFPGEPLIKCILEALLLSRKGLQTDPAQFVPQLLGRLKDNETTAEFKRCLREYSSKVWFEPDVNILERPGGQLLHSIHVHASDIDMMTIMSCGSYVITVCSGLNEIKIWNIKIDPPRLLRNVTGKGQCKKVAFCHGDEWVAMEVDSVIKVETLKTGKQCMDIPFKGDAAAKAFCVAGKRRDTIVTFFGKQVNIYDFTNGSLLQTLTSSSDEAKFGAMSNPSGRDRYVGMTSDDQYFLSVLDLDSMTLMPAWRGCEKYTEEDWDGEFFEVPIRAFGIPPDETHIVYLSWFTNEIVFADFNGNRLRCVRVDEMRDIHTIKSVNFTADGRFIFYIEERDVVFMNYSTLQEEDRLEHKHDVTGACTVDMVTVVTIAEDNNLRVWDRSRDKKGTTHKQARTLDPIDDLWDFFPLGNQDAIFVTERFKGAVGLYDVGRLEYRAVRKLSWMKGLGYVEFYRGDNRSVVMYLDRKVYLFDLEKMDVCFVFPGIVSEQSVFRVTERKQLLVTSRGGKNLKLYNVTNGCVDAIIKTGHTKNINGLEVNEPGTLAAVSLIKGPIVLMNLVTYSRMYEISARTYRGDDSARSVDYPMMLFTRDSTRFFFGAYKGLDRTGDVNHLICWDLEQKQELFELCDRETQAEYEEVKSNKSTKITYVYRLDDDRIMTTCLDNVVRVYDVKTGKLLHRLTGHRTTVELALSDVTPYFLTYGRLQEENCIFLWDKATCSRVATFSLDETVKALYWSDDGTFFYTPRYGRWNQRVSDVIKWTIHNGNRPTPRPDVKQSPPLYSNEAILSPLIINAPNKVEKGYQPEVGDPDTDDEVFDTVDEVHDTDDKVPDMDDEDFEDNSG
ncbi:hypothetical protein DPMN_019963 [Dreissena polymorpha]|uniref:NWD1/2-like winged helix-turn-helix domain-containing protein n=1 Tax=Dreissena polymorpha TaxID=45954 RepID=A0A9D4NLW0_DREPO|nr:hypothetical protein DPMN_019963 [Dreissena polymorpha]